MILLKLIKYLFLVLILFLISFILISLSFILSFNQMFYPEIYTQVLEENGGAFELIFSKFNYSEEINIIFSLIEKERFNDFLIQLINESLSFIRNESNTIELSIDLNILDQLLIQKIQEQNICGEDNEFFNCSNLNTKELLREYFQEENMIFSLDEDSINLDLIQLFLDSEMINKEDITNLKEIFKVYQLLIYILILFLIIFILIFLLFRKDLIKSLKILSLNFMSSGITIIIIGYTFNNFIDKYIKNDSINFLFLINDLIELILKREIMLGILILFIGILSLTLLSLYKR